MKVTVVGSNQVIDVEGSVAPGDILMFISTMAVVKVDEDEAEVMLVSNTMTGVKTSELFRKFVPEITDIEIKEVADAKDNE